MKNFPSTVVASARSSTFSFSQCLQDVYIPTLGICLHCVRACSSSCAPFISEDILLFCVLRVEGAELKNDVYLLSWCWLLSKACSLADWASSVNEAHCMENINPASTAHLVSNCSCYVTQQLLRVDSRSLCFCSSG